MLTACSLLWISSTVSSLSGCESKRQCPRASREKRIHAFSWVVGKLPEGLTWGAEAVSCVCKTGGQHLPALGVFDPSRGDSAGEWQDLNPSAPDCRILAAQPDAFPPSRRDLADPLRLCCCGVSEAPVCCPLCTSEGHLLPPAFIPPANPRATLGIHVFGRRAEKGVGVPAGSSECSRVEHRVVWLLGTSCCLMVLPEAGLAVSAAAHGPEFLAGARRCWAATPATLLG